MELCLSPDLGGLELYVFRSSVALNASDDVVPVINPAGRLRRYFSDYGFSWHELEPKFKALPLIASKRLAQIIDKERVDVIHVHWTKDLPLAVLAKRLSRRKARIVYTRQMQITRSKQDFYHEFIYGNIDLILAITEALASDIRKYIKPRHSSKVRTLYYGVKEPEKVITAEEKGELRAELGVPGVSFMVGIFGRIKHEKGQYLLVRAVKKLREEGLDVYALIVGHPMDESYLAGLKNTVNGEQLEGYVVFKDFVENPQVWMQACDAVVLASQNETFGLVLAEAMQAGVAVVGTNSGGVTEIIEDRKSGLLFEPGDSDGLAACIGALVNDSAFRQKLAQNGQAKARAAFDYSGHYEKLRSLMADCSA
jgi:glycosyltransferase involved in cell wall biosynthesis